MGLDPGLRHRHGRWPQGQRLRGRPPRGSSADPAARPVGEALTDGWLSTAKARVIIRAIDHLPGNPDVRERGATFMLSEAKGLDATELRRVGKRLVSVVDPDGEARREEHELDREERSDHGARMLDALMTLCERAAKVELLPECHGVTPRVSVTIGFEDLKRQSGYGTTETGEDLSAGTIRRMACDADIIPIVLGGQSEVLDIGRQQRLATAAIWKALVARDRHCRFPDCTRPPVMCHAHHIVHWCDGGETSLTNMILLCGHHHRLIHAAPWDIRRTGPNELAYDPPPGVRPMTATGREPPDP